MGSDSRTDGSWGLSLEHATGFSGQIRSGLQLHPSGAEMTYAVGACIVIASTTNPTDQSFLHGHDAPITCLALSPNAKLLASGQTGKNADLLIWNYAKRSIAFRLSEHDFGVACVAFSPDGKLLASVGNDRDRKMIVWDTSSGCIVASVPANPVSTVALAWGGLEEDGQGRHTGRYRLATAGGKTLLTWILDPNRGTLTSAKCTTGSVVREYVSLAFAPAKAARWLHAGTTTGDVASFSLATLTLQSTTQPVCARGVNTLLVVDNIAAGRWSEFVVGGGDGTVTVVPAPDSTAATAANTLQRKGSGHVEIGTLSRRNPPKLAFAGSVTSLSATDTSAGLMLVGTAEGYIHTVTRPEIEATMIGENHTAGVTGAAFLPDRADVFASCSSDGSVRLWDLDSYSSVAKGACKNVGGATCVALAPGACFSGWADGQIRCHANPQTSLIPNPQMSTAGELVWAIPEAHPGGVTALISVPEKELIVTGGEHGEVRTWNIRTRQMKAHMKLHTARITGLAEMSGGTQVLSCSRDHSLQLWDLRTERSVKTLIHKGGAINGMAVHPDKVQVVTIGQDRHVTVWDLRQSEPVHRIPEPHTGEPTCVAFSASGALLATAGSDHAIRLWEFPACQFLAENFGHSGTVRSIKFSPDARKLISTDDDGLIMIWSLSA